MRAIVIPVALVGLAIALWIGAASFVTYRILHPPFLDGGFGDIIFASEQERAAAQLRTDPQACCGAAFESLHVTDADRTSVDAWFIPATQASAILLVPPSGASKRAMLPYLKFLHAAGFPVLMIDDADLVRDRAGWGWDARGMARAATSVLRQKGFASIGALGVSEGAAAILLAQGKDDRLFKVIVADSSFANLDSTLRSNPSLGGLNPAFLQTVKWELGFVMDRSIDDISPASASARIKNGAVLVVQNANDPFTPEADGRAIAAARIGDANRRLYIVPSNGHGDAIYADPQNYQTTVLGFLAQNLSR